MYKYIFLENKLRKKKSTICEKKMHIVYEMAKGGNTTVGLFSTYDQQPKFYLTRFNS